MALTVKNGWMLWDGIPFYGRKWWWSDSWSTNCYECLSWIIEHRTWWFWFFLATKQGAIKSTICSYILWRSISLQWDKPLQKVTCQHIPPYLIARPKIAGVFQDSSMMPSDEGGEDRPPLWWGPIASHCGEGRHQRPSDSAALGTYSLYVRWS